MAHTAVSAISTHLREAFGEAHGIATADGIVAALGDHVTLVRCAPSPAELH